MEEDPLLTIQEVSRLLRVNDISIRRWIQAGTLPAIELPHIGKRKEHRIKKSVVDAITEPKLQGK